MNQEAYKEGDATHESAAIAGLDLAEKFVPSAKRHPLWTGLLLSRRYARALEQCADDAVVTAAGIRGLASTLEEEDARARAWMRDNGVETWAEAREIYLREDPAHPPLPVRIDRLLARLPVDDKDTV